MRVYTFKQSVMALSVVLIGVSAAFSQNSEAQTKAKIAVYVTGSVGADENKALGTKILVELINSGRYRAVERSADFIKELDREQLRQMSGAVDDNQITRIGKQFGVQVICVADLTQALGSYQISARLIDVESAEITAIAEVSSRLQTLDDLTVASEDVVMGILGLGTSKASRLVESPPPQNQKNISSVAIQPVSTPKQGYYPTSGERWGTFGINWLIPGLGSFVIMKDNIGGGVQLGLAVTGYALYLNGVSIETDRYGYSEVTTNSAFWIGLGTLFGNFIFNVVRSSTYSRPSIGVAANDNDNFNFAVFPDKNGDLKAVVAYSMSF